MEKYRVGIDVGGTNIEFCAIPENAQSKAQAFYRHCDYPKNASCANLCSCLKSNISCLLSENDINPKSVSFIGIAMPGSLSTADGIVFHAYNLNLHNANIISEMQKLISSDVEICLINDADAATMGEFKLGALRNVTSGCLITLGTGVGAGLIIDGKLYTGGQGRGTELGHMTLNLNGEKCTCGNIGCIETLCSATAIAKMGSEAFGKSMSAKDIFTLAKQNNPQAQAIFNSYVNSLSSALASYISLLDPELIAIGGGVGLAGDFLLEPLKEKTAEKSFFSPICDIVAAQLGNKAGAIGAAFAR